MANVLSVEEEASESARCQRSTMRPGSERRPTRGRAPARRARPAAHSAPAPRPRRAAALQRSLLRRGRCRCCASSSTISGSRAMVSGGRCSRTWRLKSMPCHPIGSMPRDALQRRQQLVPAGALLGEHLPAGRRQLVVAAAALPGLLEPPAIDPAAALHAIEHRIERSDVKPQHAAGPVVDQLGDFVAVPLPFLEDRQDHQVGAAALQLSVWRHIWRDNIASGTYMASGRGLAGSGFAGSRVRS